jgi:phytoene desaturase
MKQTVLIVGAGLGGLATALRLSKQGYSVQILEKNDTAGGRLNQIQKDGFTFDTGPSFFSMSYEFEAFAKECNISLPFTFVELDPLYSVHISGSNKTWHIYKDTKLFAEQFTDIEVDFEKKFEEYIAECSSIFHDTVDIVIKRNFSSKFAYFIELAKVNPFHIPKLFKTFWQQVCQYFSSQEARQILSLVAFFLGKTPFDTSSVYTLLSYTEFKHDGYYNVEGGMYQIVTGILHELEKQQVPILYNTEICDVQTTKNTITAVIDTQGNSYKADIFVINADAAVFRSRILKRKAYSESKLLKKDWTMGYLTFYLGISTKLPQVHHHNYYLGSNYEEYSKHILQDPSIIEKPYYYVNVVSKYNTNCAPEGCESLFFVCPVPNLIHKSSWHDAEQIVNSIIQDFSQRIELNIEPLIISKTIYTPADWEKKCNLFKGSGLGLSHSIKQIGGLRPRNFDEKFKNMFYVGASTVPGAGLPMAIISSKLATERVINYSK